METIIKLMKKADIMDNEEFDYWVELLPFMNETQQLKFKKILENHIEKEEELFKKYSWERNTKSKKEIYEEIFINN